LASTRYGRVAVAEPPSSLARTHWHDGSELKPVTHKIPIPVLDQQDLVEQGIDTARIVPGAKEVDALGSCVANATTACLSAILPEVKLAALGITGSAVTDEEFAIRLYHNLTMLTGNPSSEWPPDDCGSSGLYACQYLEAHDIISGHKIAHGAENILSLLQQGPLIVGQPFLNAWETPEGPDWFVDGDGSPATLAEQITGGVAGGHETCVFAVEHVEYDESGHLDPFRTLLVFRNSWAERWGDAGNARIHLSTFVALGNYCDFRLLTA
jgi:hypothetical protein